MNFFARLWLAVVSWFRIVFSAEFAAKVRELEGAPPKELPPAAKVPAGQALHLLSILQREGRLVDFCEEEIGGYSDAQIGAAARTVHDGCRKALRSLVTLAPVRAEPEGAQVALPPGFEPREVRLTGTVGGNPPFRGVLRHHGWRAAEVRMPAAPESAVIAPAEVELP